MEGNERKGNNTVLLTIIGIATLLVAIVGATFAYFTATVTGGDSASSIVIKTATLALIYHDGQDISINGIVPGWEASKTVTVTNETGYNANYTLRWKTGVFNSLADKDELQYTVTCTAKKIDESASSDVITVIPAASSTVPGNDPATSAPINIVANQVISPSTVHTCKIDFEFVEINSEQNYNQGKTFNGTLELVAEAVSS